MRPLLALPDTLIGFIIQVAFLVISGVVAVFLPVVVAQLARRYGLQIEQEKRDALRGPADAPPVPCADASGPRRVMHRLRPGRRPDRPILTRR